MPCLNFYREIYNLSAWEPVEGQNGPTLETGDYVVFDNAGSVSSDRLKQVFLVPNPIARNAVVLVGRAWSPRAGL